jgi:HK97 family phage portal protein
MGLANLLTQFRRVPETKTSRAGPMIAMHNIGQPKWTPRRTANLAEEGFRKNTIAYRCVMQIATASAAVPWLLYDKHGHEVDTHPLLDLLAHPNPTQDGVTFLESVYANLQISGNAYIEALRPDPDRPPTELYNLRPDRMSVIPGPTGLPQGYQYNVNGQVTTWPADPISGASNILHLKCFHPLDDWYGMAPMEAALLSIDQHNASGAWNQALLNQGARPSGALVYAPKDGGPSTLSDDQLQRLREEMGMLYQGDRNAGRPLILEGGLDWREMSLSPKDMDWLAGRSAAARDIALAFGVPAQLIGIPDAQTYANVEQARLAFYEETVMPLVTRVIAGVDHWLCPMYPDRPELDFDADEISALTDKRQAQFAKLQTANFLTRNEKREAAGYGPVIGGDVIDDGESSGAKYNHNHDPANGQFTFGDGGEDGRQPTSDSSGSSGSGNSIADTIGNALQTMLGVGSADASELDPAEDEIRSPAETDPLAEVRTEQYQNALSTLRQLDPSNRELESLTSPDWVPSNADIDKVNQAIVNASNQRLSDFTMPDGSPIGVQGRGRDIRLIDGNATDAQDAFEHLTVGSTLIDNHTYNGVLTQLPGGCTVGYRPFSSDNLPTLDFNSPLVPFRSIHYK